MADIQAQTASLEGMLKTVGSPDEAMDMAYKEMVLSNSGRKGYQTFLKTFKLSTGSYFISLFRRKRSNRNRRSLDIKCFRCGTFLYFRRLFKDERAKKTANEQIIAQYQANGTPLAEIQQLETLLYVKRVLSDRFTGD